MIKTMKTMPPKLCALALAVLTLTGGVGADEFDDFVEQSMRRYQVPGCAVAVVHKGKVVRLRGYGQRRLDQPSPVDADTVFQIASSTKVLNASLVMDLVEEKKLDLDRPVIDYLPELQTSDSYVTAHLTTRDLLAHRSGMPAFQGDLLQTMQLSRAEILRRLRYFPLSNGFRQKAGYSNLGIFVSGMAAARVAGSDWETLMQQRLFRPLGMSRSAFHHGPLPPDQNFAYPHLSGGTLLKEYEDHSGLAPAGAVTTSARDLSCWVLMLLSKGSYQGKQVLEPASVEEMFQPVMVEEPGIAETAPIDENSGFAYGLTWGLFSYQGHRVAEKGGARAGMRSVIVVVPQAELGVVVLANLNGTLLPEAIRARVLSDYLGIGGRDLQAEIWKTQGRVQELFARATHRPQPMAGLRPARPLADYQGEYRQDLYGPLQVVLRGGGLHWQVGPDFGGPLLPAGQNSFWLSYPEGVNMIPEMVHFTVDEKGRAIELLTESFGRYQR